MWGPYGYKWAENGLIVRGLHNGPMTC